MLTFTNAATNIVFDGNSLFANPIDVDGVYSNNNRIGEKMLALAPINGGMTYKNVALGGATFKTMVSGQNGQSGIAELTAAYEPGKQNILFFLEGVNTALTARPNGAACTGDDIIQDCKDYLAAVKTVQPGWRAYAVLAPPYKDDTEPSVGNAAIDGYNAYIRANYASMGLEGYVETRRADGQLPYQPPYTYGHFFPGGGYYVDAVHFSAKGNDVFGEVYSRDGGYYSRRCTAADADTKICTPLCWRTSTAQRRPCRHPKLETPMIGQSISSAPIAGAPTSISTGAPQPPADTIKPAFEGSLSHSKTASSITVDWSGTTSSDNVAVARREYRIGGSGPYAPASSAEEASKQHVFAGLPSATLHVIEVRCVDTSGNVSDPLSISVTTNAGVQPDGSPPSFVGALAHTKTSSSITVDWSGTTSSDNVAVARREYRIGGSGPYTPATSAEESSKRHTFAGLPSAVPHVIDVRCVDTSENVSMPLRIIVTTSAAPAPGGDGYNHIRYDLVTKGEVPHLNLDTLDWSLFAQLRVKDLGIPVAQGMHTMVAGSPLLDIAVPAATVPAGWYFFVLADAAGTTAVASPVLVS